MIKREVLIKIVISSFELVGTDLVLIVNSLALFASWSIILIGMHSENVVSYFKSLIF